MKIYSPKKIIFPKGVARGEYDVLGWINLHMSRTSMQLIVYYTESTHGHGLSFLLLLTDFHMLHLLIVCFSYFWTSNITDEGSFPKCTNYALKLVSYCVFTNTPFTSNDPIFTLKIQHLCHFALAKINRNIERITVWIFGYWYCLCRSTICWFRPLIERRIACLWALPFCLFSIDRLPRTFTYQRRINMAGKFARLPKRWNMKFIFGEYEFYSSESRVQLNHFINIFIWGIIIIYIRVLKRDANM